MNVFRLQFGPAAILAGLLIASCTSVTCAHPMVENGLDVVISRDRITINARISPEQVRVVETASATQPATEQQANWVQRHASYVRDHLIVRIDGRIIVASSVEAMNPQAIETAAGGSVGSSLVPYRLKYPLTNPPGVVRIDQTFLREFNSWSASCVLRIRQVDDATYDTALLTRERTAEFDCVWPATPDRTVHEIQRSAVPVFRAHLALVGAAVILAGGLCLFLLWRISKSDS